MDFGVKGFRRTNDPQLLLPATGRGYAYLSHGVKIALDHPTPAWAVDLVGTVLSRSWEYREQHTYRLKKGIAPQLRISWHNGSSWYSSGRASSSRLHITAGVGQTDMLHVFLHELAHVDGPVFEAGHPKAFWQRHYRMQHELGNLIYSVRRDWHYKGGSRWAAEWTGSAEYPVADIPSNTPVDFEALVQRAADYRKRHPALI